MLGGAGCGAVDKLLIDCGQQRVAVPNVIGARRIRRAAHDGTGERIELVRVEGRGGRRGLEDARSEFVVGVRCRGVVEAGGEHAIEVVPHVTPATGLDEVAVVVERISWLIDDGVHILFLGPVQQERDAEY